MRKKHHVIGVDFGTLSARALLLDTDTGLEIATCAMDYPSGVLDRTLPCGTPLKDQSALQDPLDYLTVLPVVIEGVLQQSRLQAEEVAALCIDFTTCTILPIDENASPLRCDRRFRDDPHAWVKLWKHHASQPEADAITALARARKEAWLPFYGDKVSSEWMLPKVLEILHDSPEIYHATHRFIEAADWLSLLLTGIETHGPTFAYLKASYAPDIGFPSDEFLSLLHPELAGLYGTKISQAVSDLREPAGSLTEKGSALCHLPVGTPLALPVLDAGAAMPAVGIKGQGELLMILGTSGVLQLNHRRCIAVPGICGCIKEGLLPGYYTYEAGLAGLGDVFDWFVKTALPEAYAIEARERGISPHALLREKAMRLSVGQSGLLALDWLCGNRSVLNDASLSGMILGLTVTTRPEEIYRALIEATAFGMKRALEAYEDAGIHTDAIYVAGGIARKDPMLMQIYADLFGCPLFVPETKEAGARGSAIYASVAAGIYPDIPTAITALASPVALTYRPIPERRAAYLRLYEEYKRLHDYFGRGENPIMKTLSALRKH